MIGHFQQMIKAIIFDCFGVLAKETWTPYRNEHFGTSGSDFEWANAQMERVSKGEFTADEFVAAVCDRTGSDRPWLKRLLHQNPPNDELFDYIRTELKPRYKIGLLSNVGSNRLRELFSDEQITLFDEKILSFEEGIAKPDIRVYEVAHRRLALRANECVFVDDIDRYCEGARMAGMKAVQYKSITQFTKDLTELL